MIVGIGIDVCDLGRFEDAAGRTDGFLERILTHAEQESSSDRGVASLAARFAAKEALAKALGASAGLKWHDAEVVASGDGRPELHLSGTVAAAAQALGVTRTHLSLSHDAGVAVAFVVLEATDG